MKYKFWDVSRDRKKKPITQSDRLLELLALAEAVIMLALVMLVSMAICASAAYNRKLVNLPIRLKPEVFYRQIGLISRMCRSMTLMCGLIWLTVLLAMSAGFIGLPQDVVALIIPLSVLLMLGGVKYYTLKIWWIGRNV